MGFELAEYVGISNATLSLIILGITVGFFIWNKLPVEVVAIGSAIALWMTGVIPFEDTLSGFGDPVVIFIAGLLIVAEGLDATGVTTWIGQSITRFATTNNKMLVYTMLISALLTSVIGLNGSTAALVPVAVVMAMRANFPTSRILMPMVFAGSAGGLFFLSGSVVNVIISDASSAAGTGPFSFFEWLWVGVPLLAGTMVIVLLFGSKLLPNRQDEALLPPDLSSQAKSIVKHYSLNNVFHLRVRDDSIIVGTEREAVKLAVDAVPQDSGIANAGLNIIKIVDGSTNHPSSADTVTPGDLLTILGETDDVQAYANLMRLDVVDSLGAGDIEASLLTREGGVVEVMIPPRSRFLGQTVQPGQELPGDDTVILAVQRQGVDRGARRTMLEIGDILLIEGDWTTLDATAKSEDVLVVDSPDLVRRQTVPMGPRSIPAVIALLLMIVLLATSVVPPAVATLLAVGLMVITRAVSLPQAYRRISWSTPFLVAGMLPMATAITVSGAGDQLASIIVNAVGDSSPYILLLALFTITIIFGQLISNTATVLVMIPIAISAAAQVGVSPRPVLMSLAVGATAAFLTPIATPGNMMVMGPGGYRFGDYWKLGLPMAALYGVIAIFFVPIIWGW